MFRKVALAVLLTAVAGAASAQESCRLRWYGFIPVVHCTSEDDHKVDFDHKKIPAPKITAPMIIVPKITAPEIDPGSAIAAFTLLAGGIAILRGRRGKKA